LLGPRSFLEAAITRPTGVALPDGVLISTGEGSLATSASCSRRISSSRSGANGPDCVETRTFRG
jgi:hypothetical protein